MDINRTSYISVIISLLFIIFQGCYGSYNDVIMHDPPLGKNISKLIEGQTTRSEVISLFGVPDLQADGNEITLYAESAMGKWRAKWRAEIENANKSLAKYNQPLRDPDYLNKIAMMQAYSSIDKEHVALLYLESNIDAQFIFSPTGAGYGKSGWQQNKLLIFIDKKTGIVDEFSYREEFRSE